MKHICNVNTRVCVCLIFLFHLSLLCKHSISQNSQFIHKEQKSGNNSQVEVVAELMSRNCSNTFAFAGQYHKSGTILYRNQIIPMIKSFWAEQCKNTKNVWKESPHTKKHQIKSISDRYDRFKASHNNSVESHLMILHSIRSPINIILSAYNYHKICREPWTRSNIGLLTKKKIWSYRYFCPEMRQVISNPTRGAEFMKRSLQNIYNEESVGIGIEIEYLRHIHCVLPSMHYNYRFVTSHLVPKYWNDQRVSIQNIRLEEIQNRFNETIQSVLGTFGVFGVDQTNLVNEMQRFDVYNSDTNNKQNQHVTHGTYNRSLQIDILLQNQHRCDQLKFFTLAMDYEWLYEAYC